MAIQLQLPGMFLPRIITTPAQAQPRLQDLRSFPLIDSASKSIFAKRFGLAAEQLCDSLLTRLGIDSVPVPDYEPYDRLIRLDGAEYRLQVKTRLSISPSGYVFRVKQGNPRHASGVRAYAGDAFDIVALVSLQHNAVKFSASKDPQQYLRLSEIAGLQASPWHSLRLALEQIGTRAEPRALPLAA